MMAVWPSLWPFGTGVTVVSFIPMTFYLVPPCPMHANMLYVKPSC